MTSSTNKVTPAGEASTPPPHDVRPPEEDRPLKKGHPEDSETTSRTSLASYETDEAHTYGHHIAATKEELKETDSRMKRYRYELAKFWEIFSAVLFSPVFLRHRNAFFLIVEVLVPGIVTIIVFAAFTGGISWKQEQHHRNDSSLRAVNYPEIPMGRTMERFKETHTDVGGKLLLMYTPVNDITTAIMRDTMELLKLQDHNRLFKNGHESTGVVGIDSEIEMFEQAMFHRMDFVNHGKPAVVVFRISEDDKSDITGIPYNITFAISLFDENIFKTADKQPFMEPAETEGWQNPYFTSGFIGLQYAIEQSIIRLILEKQTDAEMKELTGRKGEFSPDVIASSGVVEDNGQSQGRSFQSPADGIDENLFEFMKRAEVEKRREIDEDEYEEEEEQGGKKSLGRSIESDGPATTHKPMPRSDSNKIVMSRRMIKGSKELPERTMKPFSANMFGRENYRHLLTFVISFGFVMAYIFMSFFIVRQIARENLCGIKDLLQLHGLPHYIHWILLLLHALVFRGITSIIVLLALTVDFGNVAIITYCNKAVLFFFIYVHQLALTFANYFIAIYVRSVRMCGIVAVTTGVLSFYLPETFYRMNLLGHYTDLLLALIFPNWCLRHAIRCLVDHETEAKEVSWGNLFGIVHEGTNKVSVGGAMLKLLLIGIVYYCLAAYIDMTTAAKLFPQTFKWYQCREKARQQRESQVLHQKLVEDIDAGHDDQFEKPPVYEEPPADKKCFVHIRNICKNYGKHKVALDSLNMNIMHEEVTVILGHSGSGKSTLISILAGLVQPTDGYAVVKGFDVQYDATRAREYIGMCPQKLVAFNLLTVQQHVVLCYRLKGYSNSQCKEPVENLLTKLRLWDIRSYLPGNLTNDELRRLGMAMALADTPKVLLLDQPTYGMDSIGRREMWDIISTLKHHHTIIIATNYMDEAEHLADRLGFRSSRPPNLLRIRGLP